MSSWIARIESRLPKGIRPGFLLSLLLVAGLAGIAVLAVVLMALRVGSAVETTVGRRLPVALESLWIARQADRMVLAAGSLAASSAESERVRQWHVIEGEIVNLRNASRQAASGESPLGASAIAPITEDLATSLSGLDALVRERIALVEAQKRARAELANNFSQFQQHTGNLSRILAGDAAVIRHNVALGEANERSMIREMAGLVPVARLETLVGFLNSKLMSISDIPTDADLLVARSIIALKLNEINAVAGEMETALASSLEDHLATLRRLALGEKGIIALRQDELRLFTDISALNRKTENIARALDSASRTLVSERLDGVNEAMEQLAQAKTTSTVVVYLVVLITVLAIAMVMHFYVNRYLLRRMNWVNDAMLAIAEGHFDYPLPPGGTDELGRLGMAVGKFRETALGAKQRENQLSVLHAKAEQTLAHLKEAQCELIRQASTDYLTGLANRQSFMEKASREWDRARHANSQVGVLLLDLDNFKSINDHHGHQTGDDALRMAAAIFTRTLRPADLLGRIGGEEFAALLPGASLAGALEAAERIREAIACAQLLREDGTVLRFTVSIGVSERSGPELSLDAALSLADTALYTAKHCGRNRVMHATNPGDGRR